MDSMRFGLVALIVTGVLASIEPVKCEVYPVILRGKVTMQDGSAPPKSVGIQRICNDTGSAPGPITNKRGEYLWRMDVDPMRTRVCRLEATLSGYTSTAVDISALNGYTSTAFDVPTLVLSPRTPDPNSINVSDSDVPGRGRPAWQEAMKALEANNQQELRRQLEAVVEAVPKFARGWHTLGIVYEALQMPAQAREAYAHAIQLDPKMVVAHVSMTRLCVQTQDWQSAAKAAEELAQVDEKRIYPEAYQHLALARYELKDLDGATASALEALNPNKKQKAVRAEYTLGLILEAKGDLAGAREHMSKYLTLEPNAEDADNIRTHIQSLGKAE